MFIFHYETGTSSVAKLAVVLYLLFCRCRSALLFFLSDSVAGFCSDSDKQFFCSLFLFLFLVAADQFWSWSVYDILFCPVARAAESE